MDFRIRKAVEDDFNSVLSLIKELAEFEKAPDKVTNTAELMKMEKQFFNCYVAETDDKEIIGIALYYAGAMTVFAQLDPAKPGFMGAFVVETAWNGVKIGKDMPKMGLKASSTAAVQFRDVRVPAENLLGKPGDGFKIAMTILNYGRLGLGAASVGLMEQSLHDMLKRAANRVQFGTPIMRFPLIQEKIVKARVNGTVSAAMNTFAAKLLDQHPLADLAIETSH